MSKSLESLMQMPAEADDTPSLGGQLIAFLTVGGSGAVAFVMLSSLAIGLHTGLADWLASAVCYGALIGPVYLAHRRFSFSSEAPHRHALPRYVAVQLCALLLAAGFSYLVYGYFGLPTVAASLLVTGLTSGVNFMVLKLWAFAATGESRAAQVSGSIAS